MTAKEMTRRGAAGMANATKRAGLARVLNPNKKKYDRKEQGRKSLPSD